MDVSYWGIVGCNFVLLSYKDIIFMFLCDFLWLIFLLYGNFCYNFVLLGFISKGELVFDGVIKKISF